MVVFFNTAGSTDHAWLLFILITLVSSMFGKNVIFQRMGIPIITGYMIIGFFCGPYVFGLMDKVQVSELTYVNQAALSFIAVSAGAEIYLPEIMPLIRPIMWISCSMIFFTMFIGTLFTYGVGGTPLLPWLVGWNSCNFGVAMLVATILSARSPTSVLAVVRELQARGEVTSTIIGITVAGDVFVLTIFAIVQAMTANFCSGTAFDVATFFVNLVMIPVAVLWGWLLGQLLVQMLRFDELKHLILPLGFLNYLICDYILALSDATGKYEIDIDALLICITAGMPLLSATVCPCRALSLHLI
jgi:Kef-type K+ transport system membrane component KefB